MNHSPADELLIDLYTNQKWSIDKIRKSYNCNPKLVRAQLIHLGIKIRTRTEARNEPAAKQKQANSLKYIFTDTQVSDIIQQYASGAGLICIAKQYKMDACVISRILKENNIAVRSIQEHNTLFGKVTAKKAQATMRAKYGAHPMTVKKFKDKYAQTMIDRYGKPCSMQNPEIRQKQLNSAHALKSVLIEDKEFKLQGYEEYGIKLLLQRGIHINDIENINVPVIDYLFKNNKHTYYPDLYIASKNLIVEVKSIWTFNQERRKNMAKINYTAKAGFFVECLIINTNGTIFKSIIKTPVLKY